MSILHLSIAVKEPEVAAKVLGRVLGGPALPFPPCPGAWIAFGEEDDGTAVELYPATARVEAGPETIAFGRGDEETGPVAGHVALTTPLGADEVLRIGREAGWQARICNRGPFSCVELWVENRVLVEVLDDAMSRDYRAGMTTENWKAMFGMEG